MLQLIVQVTLKRADVVVPVLFSDQGVYYTLSGMILRFASFRLGSASSEWNITL